MTTTMEVPTTVTEVVMLPGGGIGIIIRMAAMNRGGIIVQRIVPAEVGAGGVASFLFFLSRLFKGRSSLDSGSFLRVGERLGKANLQAIIRLYRDLC